MLECYDGCYYSYFTNKQACKDDGKCTWVDTSPQPKPPGEPPGVAPAPGDIGTGGARSYGGDKDGYQGGGYCEQKGKKDWGAGHKDTGGSQYGNTIRAILVNEATTTDGQSLWDAVNKQKGKDNCQPVDKW